MNNSRLFCEVLIFAMLSDVSTVAGVANKTLFCNYNSFVNIPGKL